MPFNVNISVKFSKIACQDGELQVHVYGCYPIWNGKCCVPVNLFQTWK